MLEVKRFQSLASSPETLQEEATRIYESYIAPQSMFEVNLDSEDREKVMEVIQERRTTQNVFENVRVKVFNIIKHDSVPRWRATSDFEVAWGNYTASKESD